MAEEPPRYHTVQVADFTTDRSGRLVRTAQGNPAFVPNPLPPSLDFDRLVRPLSAADRALGHLAGIVRGLPNPRLLMNPFARREAVLSSRIEGTQASLADLVMFEAAPEVGAAPGDVGEVVNYLRALDYGTSPRRKLPVSLRLIRELHRILMSDVRGETMRPGEFRDVQNYLGVRGETEATATYVPPPVPEMRSALDGLERYLHAPSDLPPLVRVALVHYQFEAIHPFLDGNGRIGRLLTSLLLAEEDLLDPPLLYLSAFFEQRRAEYYDRLLGVSQRGAYEAWVGFFLEGVATQAQDAVRRADRLHALREQYRNQLLDAKRTSAVALQLVDLLFERPALSAQEGARRCKVTHRAAMQALMRLKKLGIVTEPTVRKRNRVFLAPAVQRIIAADRG